MTSTDRATRRTRKSVEPREKKLTVRVNDEEHALISAAAKRARRSVGAYLFERGVEPLKPVRTAQGAFTPIQMRALAAELYAMKRILRGAATNLNQAAKVANATGEVPDSMRHDSARLAATLDRLEAFVEQLREWMVIQ